MLNCDRGMHRLRQTVVFIWTLWALYGELIIATTIRDLETVMHRITHIYLLIIACFVSLVMTSVATRARGKSVNHILVVLYTFYRPMYVFWLGLRVARPG